MYECVGVDEEWKRWGERRRRGRLVRSVVGVRTATDEVTAVCFRPFVMDCWSRMIVSAEKFVRSCMGCGNGRKLLN